MKFEWYQAPTVNNTTTYTLWLMYGDRPMRAMGSMLKLPRAWKIMEVNVGGKPDFYWLDGDLSLEEAQRAAKLFLCVGKQ